MASAALILRRTAASPLITHLLSSPLRTTHFAPAAFRSFNTSNSQIPRIDYDDDGEISTSEDDERPFPDLRNRRLSRLTTPSFFPDVFGMSPILPNPFVASGSRRGWDVKEDKDGLCLRMDMPGLGKENVKVFTEQNTLVIKGEAGKEEADEDERQMRRYSNRIDLPEKMFKLDGIKAEMKNGVLKVMVPKVKAEERTDVRHVQIQ